MPSSTIVVGVDRSRDALLLVLGAGEHPGVMRLRHGSAGRCCLNPVVCPLVAVPVGPAHPAGTSFAAATTTGGGDGLRAHRVR